jgi:hypothetical protein
MSLTQYEPRSEGLKQGQVFDSVNGWGSVQSPQYIYDIVPAQAIPNNIALAQTPAGAGYAILAAGPGVSQIVYLEIGNVMQLDVPRNITVTRSGSGPAFNVTIYGWDYRGYPLQETLPFALDDLFRAGLKAFSKVRDVYLSSGTGAAITVGTGNIFGLPYRIDEPEYGWVSFNRNSYLNQINGTLAAGNLPVLNPLINNDSLVFTSHTTDTGSNLGHLDISSIEQSQSFNIRSDNPLDVSRINWDVVKATETIGQATLTAGTVTVLNSNVAANSIIIVTRQSAAGALGFLETPTASIVSGVSFVINSKTAAGVLAADTSIVNYKILSPGAGAATYPLQGTATLSGGTANVLFPLLMGVVPGTYVNLVSYNTKNLAQDIGHLHSDIATGPSAGLSFNITSTVLTDISTVNWQIVPAITVPLGGDIRKADATQTATSGDVRGTVTSAIFPDGNTHLVTTFYVEGSQTGDSDPSVLYGQSQFYLGDH